MKEESVRVAVFTTSYPRFPGDEASIFVKRMVRAFDNLDLKGVVIVPFDRDEPTSEQEGKFQVCRYKYGIFCRGALAFGSGIVPNLRANPFRILQAPLLLARMAFSGWSRRREIDIYHANWAVSGLAARCASLFSGKPYVITLRGEDARLLQKAFFRTLLSGTVRHASAITSVNQSFLDLVRQNFQLRDEVLHCIPNGVELPRVDDSAFAEFQRKVGVNDSCSVILFTGTVIPRKRIELLLELVAEEGEDSLLLICGRQTDREYLQQLEKIAEQRECSKRVRFAGAVPPEEIPFYLRLASVYISASEHEGRSNSVLEALSAGLPVIASDIPGHRELIEHEKNGLLFSLDSPQELLSSYRRVVRDAALQNSLGEAATRSVAGLTWESTAQSYRDLFLSCLASHR